MDLIFKHMVPENGIMHHLQWTPAWKEFWGYGWVEMAFVFSDDMAKPKISTPASNSVECQDQNTFQLLYLLLEDAKSQLCTLASAAWGWRRELSSAQYWQYSFKDALHCQGNDLTTQYSFPASICLVTSSSKDSSSLLLKSFWWCLLHEQTHSGDRLSYRKHKIIPWVLSRGDLKFGACWENPCRHCGNLFKDLFFFRHDAQDVSLEITLSIHLNNSKLWKDFFHIWMWFSFNLLC